jgi:hypothetical protein
MTLPEQLHRRGEGPTAGMCTGGHVTADALFRHHDNAMRLERIERALYQIASCSPRVLLPGQPGERSCALCLAHINLAREALCEQPWPNIPHTPVASSPDHHEH